MRDFWSEQLYKIENYYSQFWREKNCNIEINSTRLPYTLNKKSKFGLERGPEPQKGWYERCSGTRRQAKRFIGVFILSLLMQMKHTKRNKNFHTRRHIHLNYSSYCDADEYCKFDFLSTNCFPFYVLSPLNQERRQNKSRKRARYFGWGQCLL